MKKNLLLFIALLIGFPFAGELYSMQRVEAVEAAQEKCYTPSRAQGIREFNAKRYQAALEQFTRAESCADKPVRNDLVSWMNKCKDRLGKEKAVVLDPDRVDLPMEGGFVKVQVKADAAEYFIENRPTWIKIEKQATYFEMDIPANSTGEEKYIELEVKVGAEIFKLPISQKSKFSDDKPKASGAVPVLVAPVPVQKQVEPKGPIPLKLSKEGVNLPAKGGSERIEVATDDPYYGVSGVPKWIQVEIAGDHILVSCSENTTGKAREREIYVVAGEDERMPLLVKQEAP